MGRMKEHLMELYESGQLMKNDPSYRLVAEE